MSTLQEHRIEPSQVSPDLLRQIGGVIHSGGASLVGPDGNKIPLPSALNDLLLFIVDSMNRKQAIFLMPEDEAFTTQAAANFLGMSRPFLLRLLDGGELPFHHVGTHRRIFFRDLVAFQTKRSEKRRQVLSEMTRKVADAGYDAVYVDLSTGEDD